MRRRLLRWAAGLAACALAAAAPAQQPGVAGKALNGEAPAQGELLSRDELRACLKEQQEQHQQAAALERRRGELGQEAATVRQQLAEVQADRLAFGGWQRASEAFKQRLQQHGQRVVLFNQRVKAFQETALTAKGAERERGEIEAEAEALARADADLKAEGAQLDATIAQARTALAAKAQAQAAAASAANTGNQRFNEEVQAHEAALAGWKVRCGSRPYRTADEGAVRAGG